MKPEWKTFLVGAGAEFMNGRVDSFGNPEQERKIIHSGNNCQTQLQNSIYRRAASKRRGPSSFHLPLGGR